MLTAREAAEILRLLYAWLPSPEMPDPETLAKLRKRAGDEFEEADA